MLFLNKFFVKDGLSNDRKLEKNQACQKYIDLECIRRMEPYTPFRIGTLKNAPISQTQIGTGNIKQNTPYARRWYYENANFTEAPRRGRRWFDRMKQEHKDDILKGARKIARAKG